MSEALLGPLEIVGRALAGIADVAETVDAFTVFISKRSVVAKTDVTYESDPDFDTPWRVECNYQIQTQDPRMMIACQASGKGQTLTQAVRSVKSRIAKSHINYSMEYRFPRSA